MILVYIIIGAVVLFFIFGIIGSAQPDSKSNKNSSKTTGSKSLPSVYTLVSEIKTIQDYRKLKAKFDRAEESYSRSESKSVEKRYRLYEEAYWEASNKVIAYQYLPVIDLLTEKDKIETAYKVVTLQEYDSLRDKIGGADVDWVEITCEDYIDKNYEPKPKYFKSLIEYQNIISSEDIGDIDKAKAIENLLKKDRVFFDEFFYGYNRDKIIEEWLIDQLRKNGVPLANKIYDLGYKTIDQLKNIDLREIKKIDGFGAKRIQKLESVIEKTKQN